MSPSDQRDRVHLRVQAGDDGTEIFVTDGRFHQVARGCGRVEVKLPPGLYQLRLRAGNTVRDEDLILDGSQPEVVKRFEALKFATPAPLAGIRETSAQQAAFINEMFGKTQVDLGGDSGVCLFVAAPPGGHPPARGLTLWRDGQQVVDVNAHAAKPATGEPWAACYMKVPAACYRLRLALPKGAYLEQSVVAAPGWHTQLFLRHHAYGDDPKDTRANLPGGAILYARDRCFDPNSPEARLSELARLGLANRRQVLADEVLQAILYGKFADPMLGLLGAHLLGGTRPDAANLIQTVVGNLRTLFGGLPHPDVEALALLVPGDPGNYRFEYPPMLRRSWELVVKASAERPEVLPPDGPAARIAEHLWGEEPWLLWMTPAPQPPAAIGLESTRPEEPDDYEHALVAHLEWLAKQATAEAGPSELGAWYKQNAAPSPLESRRRGTLTGRWGELRRQLPRPKLRDDEFRRLVTALGLPRSRIERMLDQMFAGPPTPPQ
jgi:hypothetical protein